MKESGEIFFFLGNGYVVCRETRSLFTRREKNADKKVLYGALDIRTIIQKTQAYTCVFFSSVYETL